MEEKKYTFVEHLTELRNRLMVSILAILIGTGVCYAFIDVILLYVMEPGKNLDFVYLSPPELFLAYIKISVILGIVLALPVLLLEIWLFVKPGLMKKEVFFIALGLIFGTGFFFVGAFFAYSVILPLTIDFFVGHATPRIEPMFSFGSYTGFIFSILLAFGLAFELPMVVIILTKLGLISPRTLAKSRKFALLIIVILAAVLTPPDVISQLLLAGPMFVLFEISILFSRIIEKKKPLED